MSSRKLVGVEKVLAERILGGLSEYGITGFKFGSRSVRKVDKEIVETQKKRNRPQRKNINL